jgi:hypothetical protein
MNPPTLSPHLSPIPPRSDPTATSGFVGNDAVDVVLAKDATGEKVHVLMLDVSGRAQGQSGAVQAPPRQSGASRDDAADSRERRQREEARGAPGERRRSRSRSRDRGRRHSRSRSRSRGRGWRERDRRSRSRSRSRERRRRSRSRSRERRRDAGPEVPAPAPAPPADPVAAAAAAAAAEGKNGWLLVLKIAKPEGPVGQLVLGPLGPTQRITLGRAPPPACDVMLEHASISRQHAALTIDGGAGSGSAGVGHALRRL